VHGVNLLGYMIAQRGEVQSPVDAFKGKDPAVANAVEADE
jgi:hypothetical protein